MMLRDENVQVWRSSPSGHLAGHKDCCLVTIWVILAHFCWARNYLQLSYEFLRILLIFSVLSECLAVFADSADFPECLWHQSVQQFQLLCLWQWPHIGQPILCSSQTRLQPLPVQTQGTQLLKVFIQLYYNNSHQQYENEVSHSSMFKISMFMNHKTAFESKDTKIDSNSQIFKNRQIYRQLGQLYCNWL